MKNIKSFKQYEGVKWYSKGKFTEDSDFEDGKDNEKEYYDDNLPDEFRSFLIKNDAYQNYMKAIEVNYKNKIKDLENVELIGVPFYWGTDKKYWYDLNKKWLDQINADSSDYDDYDHDVDDDGYY